MKKNIKKYLMGFCIMLILTGCNSAKNESSENSDSEWLTKFYTSDYEYKKTTSVIKEEGQSVSSVMEGKVAASPYKEYVKVVEPEESAWSEAYYYGSGDSVDAKLNTENGYVSQKIKRTYPYGYDQKLQPKYDRSADYNDVKCDVYTAEYQVDLSEQYGVKEELTAEITQEYYVDAQNDNIVCIETDLTDLNEKNAMAIQMVNEGLSVEEAKRSVEKTDQGKQKETLEIYSLGDEIEIEIP